MLFIISLFISVSSIMAADLTKVNNNINLELYGPKKKLVNEILRKRNADDSTYEEGNKNEVYVFNHESPYQIISSDSEVTSNYIYFKKPNEWANPHAYLTGDIENSWPGVKLNHVTGNIYSFRRQLVTFFRFSRKFRGRCGVLPAREGSGRLALGSTYNTNSNYKYKLSKVTFEGFNKVYKISEGSTSTDEQSSGSWNNYEEKEVLGRIYYRVPTTWEYPHAYIFKDNGAVEPLGKWPGVELTKYKDNIYYFEITSDMIDDNIINYTVTFNNGGIKEI